MRSVLGPILRGWHQYYGHLHSSAPKSVWRRVNRSLIGWLMRKHKKLTGHKTRAVETLTSRCTFKWSDGLLALQ